jgi:predicted metal-dependent hydrolase
MIQICEVETEHGCICYQLERKNVRNINLRIRTDASVYISAPKDVPESVVTQFVKRRSRYIAEAQQHFREFQQYAPQPRHYISGESFSVLGRSLRLRVEQGKKDDIRSDGVYLYLTVKDTEDQEQKKRLVDRYLNNMCREIFSRRWISFIRYFENMMCHFHESIFDRWILAGDLVFHRKLSLH